MSEADSARRCEMLLLVQAEFDGELDAAQAAQLSLHRAGCAVCRRASRALGETRAMLREIEELSYKEIAQITETPIGTVMSRLWRGRQMLAAAVKAEQG